MYFGLLGKHGLCLAWKLGLHPYALSCLSTISSSLPKLVVLPAKALYWGYFECKVCGKMLPICVVDRLESVGLSML
jgi:hypothetical protein